jgi:hypothetical protein
MVVGVSYFSGQIFIPNECLSGKKLAGFLFHFFRDKSFNLKVPHPSSKKSMCEYGSSVSSSHARYIFLKASENGPQGALREVSL